MYSRELIYLVANTNKGKADSWHMGTEWSRFKKGSRARLLYGIKMSGDDLMGGDVPKFYGALHPSKASPNGCNVTLPGVNLRLWGWENRSEAFAKGFIQVRRAVEMTPKR